MAKNVSKNMEGEMSDLPTDLVDRTEVVEEYPIEQIITDEFIQRFEKQADLYQNKYLPICIRMTNEADWIDHGKPGSPKYSLQCSGAEKLCNPLGVKWSKPAVVKHEREDEKGRFYEYEVEGIVSSNVLRRYGWFTGNCDSRDKFFVARGDFAEGDIRKAAFSNWLVNAVTRLAGIRNPSLDMLAKAGLVPGKIQSIDYGRARTPDQGNQGITLPQLKRLYAICTKAGVSSATLRESVAKKYNLPTVPETDDDLIKAIKRGDYEALCTYCENGAKQNGNTATEGSQPNLGV